MTEERSEHEHDENDVLSLVLSIFPDATLGEDNDAQIVIYTNCQYSGKHGQYIMGRINFPVQAAINSLVSAVESEAIHQYLVANTYADIEAWGRDSDYLKTGVGWVDLDDNPVDLREQLLIAIEAAASDTFGIADSGTCDICGSDDHFSLSHGEALYLLDTSCKIEDLIDKKMDVLRDVHGDAVFDRRVRELEILQLAIQASDEPDLGTIADFEEQLVYVDDKIDALISDMGYVVFNNSDANAWLVYNEVG